MASLGLLADFPRREERGVLQHAGLCGIGCGPVVTGVHLWAGQLAGRRRYLCDEGRDVRESGAARFRDARRACAPSAAVGGGA